MTGFSETQKAFAGAVLDAEAAVPTGLARKTEGAPSRRFSVYRNNVYAGLIDVLAGRFQPRRCPISPTWQRSNG